MDQFFDVLSLLQTKGHSIMIHFAKNSPQNLMADSDYYDCVFGNAFLSDLFKEKVEEPSRLCYFDSDPEVRRYSLSSSISKGFIYHFALETDLIAEEPEIFPSQVHYFTIIYDQTPLLIQTLGGVQGILVKRIYSDINQILDEIIQENSETYTRLFEIPLELEDLTYYRFVSMKCLQVPLYYPDLEKLDQILSPLSLDYAKEKISNLI